VPRASQAQKESASVPFGRASPSSYCPAQETCFAACGAQTVCHVTRVRALWSPGRRDTHTHTHTRALSSEAHTHTTTPPQKNKQTHTSHHHQFLPWGRREPVVALWAATRRGGASALPRRRGRGTGVTEFCRYYSRESRALGPDTAPVVKAKEVQGLIV
jgi:hypothetical protein